MRIGICTGGGDVPGLNPCIKAVVTRVADGGHEVVGIRRGWAGLLETNPDDAESIAANVVPLTPGGGAHDRPHRRHDPPHVAHEPRPGQDRATCPPSSPTRRSATARSTSPPTRSG